MEETPGITKTLIKEIKKNNSHHISFITPENTKQFTFENKTLEKLNGKEMKSMEMFEFFTQEKSKRNRIKTALVKKSRKSLARSLSSKDLKKTKEKQRLNENKFSAINATNAINRIKIPQSSNLCEEEEELSESASDESFDLNDQIDKKMREMKDKMLNKLEKYKRNLERNYDNHIKKIKSSLMQKAKRISQVINNNIRRNMESKNSIKVENNSEENNQFSNSYSNFYPSQNKEFESPKNEIENMRKYTHKNLNDKMTHIFDLHEKIESSLDKNFEILNNFLNNFDLSQEYPMEDFVNENAVTILDSWIFSKINFEKLNMIKFIENDKIPNNLKNFIYQDTYNKFSMISIKKSKNYEFDKNLMFDNYLILEKLCFKDFNSEEFKKILTQISQIEGMKFKQLKEILIEDCILLSSNFNNLFPNTERILIKNSLLKLNFTNISKDFSKLKILSIKNSNFNDKNLLNLLEDFCFCKEILENLEIIDLSNNKLTCIDLSPLSNYNQKFYSLQIFILNKNKIHKFKPQNLNCLPGLKFLNLSSNNFTCPKDFSDLREKSRKLNNKLLILTGNNFFNLNSKTENNSYIKYLTETLKDFDFSLKKLDFNKSFNRYNKNSLLEIHFNTNLQISLKKLNLTFCSLDSTILCDFIKNISGFINLKTFDVSDNFIDDNFFRKYDEENLFNLMENLEIFKLRNNIISAKCLSNLENILKKQKKLKQIFLCQNLIENNFIELMRSNSGFKKINSSENLRSLNHLALSNSNEESIFRETPYEEIKNNSISNSNEFDISKFYNFFDSLINLRRDNLKIFFSKKAEGIANKFLSQCSDTANISLSNSFSSNLQNSNSNDNNHEELIKKKEFILKKFIKFESKPGCTN